MSEVLNSLDARVESLRELLARAGEIVDVKKLVDLINNGGWSTEYDFAALCPENNISINQQLIVRADVDGEFLRLSFDSYATDLDKWPFRIVEKNYVWEIPLAFLDKTMITCRGDIRLYFKHDYISRFRDCFDISRNAVYEKEVWMALFSRKLKSEFCGRVVRDIKIDSNSRAMLIEFADGNNSIMQVATHMVAEDTEPLMVNGVSFYDFKPILD